MDLGAGPEGGGADYIRRVNSIPVLTAGEEQDLRALLGSQDPGEIAGAKKRLIESQLRLVVSLSHRYRESGLSFAHLVNVGNEGLIRALERFDPASAYRFSSYATWWIRQAITRAIADRGQP